MASELVRAGEEMWEDAEIGILFETPKHTGHIQPSPTPPIDHLNNVQPTNIHNNTQPQNTPSPHTNLEYSTLGTLEMNSPQGGAQVDPPPSPVGPQVLNMEPPNPITPDQPHTTHRYSPRTRQQPNYYE